MAETGLREGRLWPCPSSPNCVSSEADPSDEAYDVDVRFDEDEGVAHIRSASRVGYGDLGVNRRRVERIREAW